MTDLFDLEQQTQRKNDRLEAAALVEVFKALNTHPAVAWCDVLQFGKFSDQSRTRGNSSAERVRLAVASDQSRTRGNSVPGTDLLPVTCKTCIHRLDVTLWDAGW